MDGFWFFIIILVVICIGFWGWMHEQEKKKKMQNELYKIVKQTGATNIHIQNSFGDSEHGVYSFLVLYTDRTGQRQQRHVTRHTTKRPHGTTDFLWDKPLMVERDEASFARLSSKEQIISDMDAEIQRLRAELEMSQQER